MLEWPVSWPVIYFQLLNCIQSRYFAHNVSTEEKHKFCPPHVIVMCPSCTRTIHIQSWKGFTHFDPELLLFIC